MKEKELLLPVGYMSKLAYQGGKQKISANIPVMILEDFRNVCEDMGFENVNLSAVFTLHLKRLTDRLRDGEQVVEVSL